MKKIFGALLIAVCIGMAMPAQAQIHFGVKGGLNLSKASFSNVKENFKKDLKSATPFPKCYLHKEKWTFDS